MSLPQLGSWVPRVEGAEVLQEISSWLDGAFKGVPETTCLASW